MIAGSFFLGMLIDGGVVCLHFIIILEWACRHIIFLKYISGSRLLLLL